ncbi:hypothetical protein Rxycam_00574 [Rubrobacter xylanophilus DSM 9941]|nr:hypothetical protein Rxycam_00574 [Rubrobacter xylanophilus DSM 9941]
MRVSGIWKLVLFLLVVAVISFALGYYGMMRFIL